MYHLSEISELKDHPMFERLKSSLVWSKPIYQITGEDWLEFKNDNADFSDDDIEDLVLIAKTSIELAKFLGQLETSRESNITNIGIDK
ncbi:MAG: hypothetical protein ABJG42_24510 [Vibrio splendidus]